VDKEIHKLVPVDTRADIYALGATLYVLVTNHVPRARKDETGEKIVDFEMRPIREWDGQLSEGLEYILTKATQRNPDDRYQTAAEMRYDLEHYIELTREYRAAQQKKVDGFKHRIMASGIALIVGLLCIAISIMVRSSSYDALVHEASVAETAERNEVIDANARQRTADASEAEELYTRAIEVSPDQIETYFSLIDLYESDSLFTATEARRWASLWQMRGRQLEGNQRFGELCYDVGVLYLVYYDYADARSITGNKTTEAASGQGAIENATQSIRWFQMALEHPESLSGQQINAAESYVTIGDFYEKVTKANREGADITKEYAEFWTTLEETVLPVGDQAAVISDAEPIVQLRVYQVAFESVSSTTYLTGFRRSGVTRDQADAMLTVSCDGARELSSFVGVNRDSAGGMYDEIINGEDEARANIARVYKSKLAQPVATE
jgi:serine/threonine-protein kinase